MYLTVSDCDMSYKRIFDLKKKKIDICQWPSPYGAFFDFLFTPTGIFRLLILVSFV